MKIIKKNKSEKDIITNIINNLNYCDVNKNNNNSYYYQEYTKFTNLIKLKSKKLDGYI